MSMPQDQLTQDMFQPVELGSEQNEKISQPSITYWKDAWRRLRKNKAAIVGMVLIIFIVFMALAGPHMDKWGFDQQSLNRSNLPPKAAGLHWLGFDGKDSTGMDIYKEHNVKNDFWFGTDSLGRDLWTRTWQGTQISLLIAIIATLGDFLIGVAYGGISAYYGGRVDNAMQRVIEILLGIPNLIILVLLILWMGAGMKAIILAIMLTGWIGMARIVRGQTLKLKSQEYVLAARTLGSKDSRIISKHLIPNSLGQIIINMMFTIPNAIFFEAFLSFIGLGIAPPEASLGSLTNDGFQSIQIYPYLAFFPALILCLLMVSFNMLADGLRDALDPKMRK